MPGPTTRDPADAGFSLTELLVVIVILGIVGGAITGVVVTTQRAEQFQSRLQEVMDDGRVSIARIRKEVRAARRVHDTSCTGTAADGSDCAPTDRLHFWLDENQDSLVQSDEQICYIVAPVTGSTQRFQLLRWTGATDTDDDGDGDLTDECALDGGSPPSGVAATILAQTLVAPGGGTPLPFVSLQPPPLADPTEPATNTVVIELELDVPDDRGPGTLEVDATVRLRNVE
ncbi:MAG TPA: type II secretion system protein [Nitriliruptorales bacterium]